MDKPQELKAPFFGRWRMFLEEKPWDGERNLYIGVHSHVVVGPRGYVQVQLVASEPGAPIPPSLTETREAKEDKVSDVEGFLQAAMDCAWEAGMRPRGFADTAGEMKAVRDHLSDMRKIAKVPGA